MSGIRPEPRVLLVDDEIRALALTERALVSSSIPCQLAHSADEALTWLKDAPQADVVVSDIRMPVTDGIEFLGRLRDEYASRRWLQIILVTGHATVDTAIAAIRLEASDYLLKPVDPAALRESVGHALKRAESLRQVERAAPTRRMQLRCASSPAWRPSSPATCGEWRGTALPAPMPTCRPRQISPRWSCCDDCTAHARRFSGTP